MSIRVLSPLDSPVLITPAAGTPSAIVLTNGSGLPLSGLVGGGADLARLTANTFTAGQTIATGIVTANIPILTLTQTWNNAAVTFAAIQANITDTASAAGSLLLDLQSSGVSQFYVKRLGKVRFLAGYSPSNVNIGPADSTGLTWSGGALFVVATGSVSCAIDGSFIAIGSGQGIGWCIGSPDATIPDALFRRGGVATIQMGSNAATPVAQTLTSHHGLGTDKAGASLILASGNPTGSGALGTISLRTAYPGSTGSTQQTPADRLVINATGITSNTVDAAPVATDPLVDFQMSGVSKAAITKAPGLRLYDATNANGATTTLKAAAGVSVTTNTNRDLTFLTGNADRTITLTGDVTLPQVSSGPTLGLAVALDRHLPRY